LALDFRADVADLADLPADLDPDDLRAAI
jgi:hypothetical protein